MAINRPPKGRQPLYSAPRALAPDDPIEGFDCGKAPLNDWLRSHAMESEGKSARTYVVTVANGPDAGRVVGYYCLASGAVARPEMPGRIRHGLPNPVPVMVLGRLGVDRDHQRRRIGPHLLNEAIRRTAEASRIAGVRALVVHAIDDEAVTFYSGYGFQIFPEGSRTLFLPIETLLAAL